MVKTDLYGFRNFDKGLIYTNLIPDLGMQRLCQILAHVQDRFVSGVQKSYNVHACRLAHTLIFPHFWSISQ